MQIHGNGLLGDRYIVTLGGHAERGAGISYMRDGDCRAGCGWYRRDCRVCVTGSVTIAPFGAPFLEAMNAIEPRDRSALRLSLLPPMFSIDDVSEKFRATSS